MSAHLLPLDLPQTNLRRVDGRVKLLLAMCALITVVGAGSWKLPWLIGLGCLVLLKTAGVPYHTIWQRVRAGLLIALFVWLTQLFVPGPNGLISLSVGPFHLNIANQGLLRGALLAGRVFGGFCAMQVLALSTSVQEWVSALAWYRVPLGIIEIMTLAYSSLFVLLEEFERLQKAQRMRLGYGSWWRTVKTTGLIGGVLFTRVFDKSQRLWESMQCRGYNGRIKVSYERKLTRLDCALTLLGLGLLLAAWVIIR
ncbi:MAG TPA: cobalt ECF transporter T component CbiQ [Desulfobacteria bacterium]|nr:cobalt ECF transporter T component CbiQ [Desulfobacteria bacterium]